MKNDKIRLTVAIIFSVLGLVLIYALPHIWELPDAVGNFLFLFTLLSFVGIVGEIIRIVRLKRIEKKNKLINEKDSNIE